MGKKISLCAFTRGFSKQAARSYGNLGLVNLVSGIGTGLLFIDKMFNTLHPGFTAWKQMRKNNSNSKDQHHGNETQSNE